MILTRKKRKRQVVPTRAPTPLPAARSEKRQRTKREPTATTSDAPTSNVDRFGPDFRALNLCHRYGNGLHGVPNLQYLAAGVCVEHLMIKVPGHNEYVNTYRGSRSEYKCDYINARLIDDKRIYVFPHALDNPAVTYLRWWLPKHRKLQLGTSGVVIGINYTGTSARPDDDRVRTYGNIYWTLYLPSDRRRNPDGIDKARWDITGSREGYHNYVFTTSTQSKAPHPSVPQLSIQDRSKRPYDHPLVPLSRLLPPHPWTFPQNARVLTADECYPAPAVRTLSQTPSDSSSSSSSSSSAPPPFSQEILTFLFERRFVPKVDMEVGMLRRDIMRHIGPNAFGDTEVVKKKHQITNAIIWLYLQGHVVIEWTPYGNRACYDGRYFCYYSPRKDTAWDKQSSSHQAAQAMRLRGCFDNLCDQFYMVVQDIHASINDLQHGERDQIVCCAALTEFFPQYSPIVIRAILTVLECEGVITQVHSVDTDDRWWQLTSDAECDSDHYSDEDDEDDD